MNSDEKDKGGYTMVVMARTVNTAFELKADKKDEFLKSKNEKALEAIKGRAIQFSNNNKRQDRGNK